MKKTMKKILCTVLVVVMCLTSVPLSGFVGLELPDINIGGWFGSKVSAVSYSGTCGKNLTWSFDEDIGVLTISGSGEMYDYSSPSSVPWSVYRSNIKSVVLPDRLTSICDYAFDYCTNLLIVTIPDGVTSIGSHAFYYCYKLTNIIIPDSVTSIGNYAFGQCSSLESITIPDSVTSIGDDAFICCASLKSITIPDSVTSIGENAFFWCHSLSSITVAKENNNYSSDEYGVLFNKGKTTLIQYPKGNNRTSYTIPNSVTSIGDEAFRECDSLVEITIPDSVITIGAYAFDSCDSLVEITIPDSVITIGAYAFDSCDSLSSITVDKDNNNYSSDEYGVLFNEGKTTLIKYPTGNKRTSYTIPDSVTEIGRNAFEYCTSLESATIGDNVTLIGINAFCGCVSLAGIIIPNSVTSIFPGAFYNCTSLTDVYYGGTETEWNEISIDFGNEQVSNATIHYNSTGPSDNPNIGDDLNKINIDFATDTYEVEVDDTVKIYAKVTCNNGIENLDMVWENLAPEGVELISANKYENGSETEWVYYATIQGLKEGTYYINLRDNNSTLFDTVKIVVKNNDGIIDEPYHPTTPSKPRIDCDDTTVEYKQNVDFDKRKKFTINGEIANYNEEHTLTDISITIKSPDANKAVFKTEDGYKDSVTFPLGKTVETGKSRDFKCTAYIKRGYNPPNGAEDLTFTCILHGKLNGVEVNGIYSTFNVQIKNLSYENPEDNKNWTPTTLIGLLDILFTSKTPKGEKPYIDCYPDKIAASTLKWQYKSIKATNAVISTIELSDALSEALDVAVDLTELGNISAIKIQDVVLGIGEDALEKVMDAYQDIAMNEIKKFYDGEIKRLLESEEYKEYLKWYSREVNYTNGNSTKITKRCPIDIFVTDEEGCSILKIEDSNIKVYDEYAAAYLSGDDKILYLPNDIGHNIKTLATDNGEMDYIIESYSKQGEYRIIEYNNIPLTKGKSYTATVPSNMTSNIDIFNPKSEDGKIIKADKDETEHKYGDKDKNCQLCGYDRTQGCSCNCHKGGISGFFFKIILFFQKLFRTNKICVCGISHY